jgi:G3E family GTPase
MTASSDARAAVTGPVRFIIIGGFLGAGKTTLLCRLAQRYLELEKRVGVITNDQADSLVDTKLVKMRGLEAKEIPAGCFCCRFDDLIVAAEELVSQTQLEILLGEPVGSCTDLVATVIRPLKKRYKHLFEVAPFSVVVDPHRLEELLIGPGRRKFRTLLSYLTEIFILKKKKATFPASIAYLFTKQLEEADIILLNKNDLLSERERDHLLVFLKERFPETAVLGISARAGEGLDLWMDTIEQHRRVGVRPLEIDYDRYAEAEAELGWLNATFKLSRREGFDGALFLKELAYELSRRFTNQEAEIAHLKMFLDSGDKGLSINIVHGGAEPELSKESRELTHQATLIVNGRIHISPEALRQAVTEGMETVTRTLGIGYSIEQLQSFRPAYPTPKYRYDLSTEE